MTGATQKSPRDIFNETVANLRLQVRKTSSDGWHYSFLRSDGLHLWRTPFGIQTAFVVDGRYTHHHLFHGEGATYESLLREAYGRPGREPRFHYHDPENRPEVEGVETVADPDGHEHCFVADMDCVPLPQIGQWCTDRFGEPGERWSHGRGFHTIWIKHKDDADLFRHRWGVGI